MLELSKSTQWQEQVARWRDELQISPTFNLFDKYELRVRGLRVTPRISNLLNLVTAEKYLKLLSKQEENQDVTGKANAQAQAKGGAKAKPTAKAKAAKCRPKPKQARKSQAKLVQEAIRNTVVDTSQNPGRRPFSGDDDVLHTMCTGATLAHLGRGRMILPEEMMYLQGHNALRTCFPDDMSANDIRKLAGEGMALPCVGLCLWCQYLLNGFPVAESQD